MAIRLSQPLHRATGSIGVKVALCLTYSMPIINAKGMEMLFERQVVRLDKAKAEKNLEYFRS